MRLRRPTVLPVLILLACLVAPVLAEDPDQETLAEFKRLFSPGMNDHTREGALEKLAAVADEDALDLFGWAFQLTAREIRTRQAKRKDISKELTRLEDELAAIQQRAAEKARKEGRPPPREVMVPRTLLQAARQARSDIEHLQEEIDAEFTMRGHLADALGAWLGTVSDDLAAKAFTFVERKGLKSRDPDERAFFVAALGATSRREARKLLVDRLSVEKDRRLIPTVVDALARQAGKEAIEVLLFPLAHERWQVRAAVVSALADVGSPLAIQPLIDRLRLEEGRLRGDIRLALSVLTGVDLGIAPGRWQTWWDANQEGFVPPGERPPPEKEDEKPAEGGGAEEKPAPERKPLPALSGKPSFYGIEIVSKRLVFVIDVSGSMNEPARNYAGDKTKIAVAKYELRTAVLALPDDALFNIVSYNAEVSQWRKGFIKAKRKERSAAAKFVETMTADGGTNIHDALKRAFAITERGGRDKQDEHGADTVFLLSDGMPTRGDVTDPDQILAEVKRWNATRRIKIHTVGVGKDHDAEFMSELAESSGGTYVKR